MSRRMAPVLTMKRYALSVLFISTLLSVATTGCGDPDPPGSVDATIADSTPDATDSGGDSETGALDATVDADGEADGSVDAEAGLPDSEMPAYDPCSGEVEEERPSCPAEGCPEGTACVDATCGGNECLAGPPCMSAADCPSGRACAGADEFSRSCEPSLTGCRSVLDCPRGFECEAEACVDRRVSCDAFGGTCPQGYFCSLADAAMAFCMRGFLRCERDSQCEESAACVDVDDDSLSECLPRGLCARDADCSDEGEGCGFDPFTLSAECTAHRRCAGDADCATGYVCLGSAGDGLDICAPEGGSCTSNADCTSPGICASRTRGAPPSCLGEL